MLRAPTRAPPAGISSDTWAEFLHHQLGMHPTLRQRIWDLAASTNPFYPPFAHSYCRMYGSTPEETAAADLPWLLRPRAAWLECGPGQAGPLVATCGPFLNGSCRKGRSCTLSHGFCGFGKPCHRGPTLARMRGLSLLPGIHPAVCNYIGFHCSSPQCPSDGDVLPWWCMPNTPLAEHYHNLAGLGFPTLLHAGRLAYTCTTLCLLCDESTPLSSSLENLPHTPAHPPLFRQDPYAWWHGARERGAAEPLADYVNEPRARAPHWVGWEAGARAVASKSPGCTAGL